MQIPRFTSVGTGFIKEDIVKDGFRHIAIVEV